MSTLFKDLVEIIYRENDKIVIKNLNKQTDCF